MPDSISPGTLARIDDFCRRFSVERGLDDDIRAELASHMEDKLLAYLSGAEKLTEEDAFVLVREHFGDPEEVKAMLADVHADAARIGIARRIGAVLAATMGVWVILNLVGYMLHFIRYLVFGPPKTDIWWQGYIYMVLSPVILLMILKRWKTKEETCSRVWFSTVQPFVFVFIVSALFIMDTVIPIGYGIAHYRLLDAPPFYSQGFLQGHTSVILSNHPYIGVLISFMFDRSASVNDHGFSFLTFSALFAQIIIWLWWCDLASRRFIARVMVVCAWVMFSCLVAIYQPAIGFGHDAAGLVRIFIDWHRDTVLRQPGFALNTVIFGIAVLTLYILNGRILDGMMHIRNDTAA